MDTNATKQNNELERSFSKDSLPESALMNSSDLNQSGVLSTRELKLHEYRKRNFCGIGEHYREFTFTLVATFGTIWLAWQAIIGSSQTYTAVKRLTSRLPEQYIVDVVLADNNCPFGYDEINYGSYWPGSEKGCFCPSGNETGFPTDMFLKGNCSKIASNNSCTALPETERIFMNRWKGGKIICQRNKTGLTIGNYQKRIKSYLDRCNLKNTTFECSKEEKNCGDRICIPKDAECPVINLKIAETGKSDELKGNFYKTPGREQLFAQKEELKNLKTCYLEDIFPVSKIFMIPSKICLGEKDFSYSFPDNYELSKSAYCEEDISYQKIDKMDYDNFFLSNGKEDVLAKIKFISQGLNDSWHIAYSRLFGSLFFQCLLKKHAAHTVFGKQYISRDLDKFISFFQNLLNKVEEIKRFQEWAFYLSLITGSISVFLKLTYLLMDSYPFYIRIFKLNSQKIVIFLMYFSFLFEAAITYGVSAGLGGISVWRGLQLKSETSSLIETNCLDKSTEFYLSAYMEAVESETDNNTANLLMFLLLLIVLLLGRCTKIFKRRHKTSKKANSIELENQSLNTKKDEVTMV